MNEQQNHNELLLAVGRLEGKMDSMQSDFRETKRSIDADLTKIENTQTELEQRVRKTETTWAWVLGASAVIAFVAPYAIHLIHPS